MSLTLLLDIVYSNTRKEEEFFFFHPSLKKKITIKYSQITYRLKKKKNQN